MTFSIFKILSISSICLGLVTMASAKDPNADTGCANNTPPFEAGSLLAAVTQTRSPSSLNYGGRKMLSLLRQLYENCERESNFEKLELDSIANAFPVKWDQAFLNYQQYGWISNGFIIAENYQDMRFLNSLMSGLEEQADAGDSQSKHILFNSTFRAEADDYRDKLSSRPSDYELEYLARLRYFREKNYSAPEVLDSLIKANYAPAHLDLLRDFCSGYLSAPDEIRDSWLGLDESLLINNVVKDIIDDVSDTRNRRYYEDMDMSFGPLFQVIVGCPGDEFQEDLDIIDTKDGKMSLQNTTWRLPTLEHSDPDALITQIGDLFSAYESARLRVCRNGQRCYARDSDILTPAALGFDRRNLGDDRDIAANLIFWSIRNEAYIQNHSEGSVIRDKYLADYLELFSRETASNLQRLISSIDGFSLSADGVLGPASKSAIARIEEDCYGSYRDTPKAEFCILDSAAFDPLPFFQ